MSEEYINEELKKWIEEHRDMEMAEPEEVEAGGGKEAEEEITGKCEICGARDAKYRCLRCGRVVCASCYWVMFGVCKECVSEDMVKKLKGEKDFGIEKVK